MMKSFLKIFTTLACIFSALEAIAENNFKPIYETNSSEKIHSIGFDKEGNYFYALKEGGNAQVWDSNNHKLIETVLSDFSNYEVMWTRDPVEIYFTGSNDPVHVLNVETLSSRDIIFENSGRGPTIISPNNRYLMKGVEIYDAQNKSYSYIGGLDYKIYQRSRWLSISDDSNTVQMASLNNSADGASVLTFVDLETAEKLTSWSPTWLLGSSIIESVLLRGNIAAIGQANNDIKLWSYIQEETIGTLSFEEDITLLKRYQKQGKESLMVWGENKISVWESDNWLKQPKQKTINHGSSTAIFYPSLSYDSQLVSFTAENKSQFQVKSMINRIEGSPLFNDSNNEFKNEVQGVFSPTDSHLLTIDKSRKKLTLWQFD